MNRNGGIAVVVILIVIVAGVIFMLLPANVSAPDSDNDVLAAVEVVSSSGGGNTVRTFELTASGAATFSMPPGIGNWRLVDAADESAHYEVSFLGADGAVDWLVSLWLPDDVAIGDYPFEATSTASDTLTAIVLPPPNYDAPDFNQSATGTISITALSDDNLLSGEFSFVAIAANGAEISVVGHFTDLPLDE